MNNKQKVAMSPEAIDQRMRELSQLHELGMAIRGARRIGKAADFEALPAGTLPKIQADNPG